MKTILVKGPALSRSGYGEQTRFALRALRRHENKYNILLINVPWGQTGWITEDDEERQWLDHLMISTNHYFNQEGHCPVDISLQVTIPNEWEKLAPINIGFTAGMETTKVAPQWIEKSYIVDKILTVSNHSKQVYENTIYDAQTETGERTFLRTQTPIEVTHYPVRSIEQEELDIELDYDFNFLTVAQMGPRKNLQNTIMWFVEEFMNDEVGLLVKTNMANCCTGDFVYCEHTLKELLAKYPDRKCKVYLLHGDVTAKQMNYLYGHPKIKCYTTITHGEGFGLPIFESVCNGLPVIAPGWSGQVDFLYAPVKSKKQKKARMRPLFQRVDYTLGQIPQEVVWEGVIPADCMWCYPQERSFKGCLRSMLKNHVRFKSQANKLQKYISEQFAADKQYTKFINAIEDVAGDNWLDDIDDIVQSYE